MNQGEPYDGRSHRRGGEEGPHRGSLGRTTSAGSSRRCGEARSASARSRSWPLRGGPIRSSPRSRRSGCTSGSARSARGYPIQLYFGDFEHLTSQIKIPDMRYYHRLANTMLDRYLLGKRRRPVFDVRTAPTICDPEKFGPVLRAANWGALQPDRLAFELGGGRTTTWTLADPRGRGERPGRARAPGPRLRDHRAARDAGRRHVADPDRAGLHADRDAAARPHLHGHGHRRSAQLAALGRGAGRRADARHARRRTASSQPVDAGQQKVSYDLYGNHWQLEKGHELLLEVTGDDSPFFRRDNIPSMTTIDAAKLTLPGEQ